MSVPVKIVVHLTHTATGEHRRIGKYETAKISGRLLVGADPGNEKKWSAISSFTDRLLGLG